MTDADAAGDEYVCTACEHLVGTGEMGEHVATHFENGDGSVPLVSRELYETAHGPIDQ